MAKRNKKKKPRNPLRSLFRTVVALSVMIVVLYIAMEFATRPPPIVQKGSSVQVGAIDGLPAAVPDPEPERRQLVYTFLLVASDDGHGNADTIMVVTYDVPNGKIGMVSIPRDTLVNAERSVPRINAAYGRGIENLSDEVSNLVGFPMDFYIVVDMQAFVELVDAIGGINFDVPVEMYYNDPTADLTIRFMPGIQYLNGEDALKVARFRGNADDTGYPLQDIGRINTQQEMIKAIAKKLLSWGSITKVSTYIDIFSDNVETNLSTGDMLYFATEAMRADLTQSVTSATLPGDGTVTYKGIQWNYVLYPEESLQMINDLVNPYVDALTLEDVDFKSAE